METKILKNETETAAKLLREGQLVAVPTETVYGLAGNGLDPKTIEAIYEVKGRPAVKPISLMVADETAIDALCRNVPEQARALADEFWPGPLTLVLQAEESVPSVLMAGGTTVGLRCPRQAQTHALLRAVPFPLAVPSANPSGEESPTTAEEVLSWFDGKISAVIDGGKCELGEASTVLDMSTVPYRILRRGSLPESEIIRVLIREMTIVGITGGSGSGKTTALEELQKRGALLLDGDAVYHELLERDGELIAELDECFPGTVRNGQVSRERLGAIVFQDPEKLKQLNEITHRHISAELSRRLGDWAMQGGTLAAIDAIELIGSGLSALCDFTLAVTAPAETRITRIMARDGITRERAEMRIRAQRPDAYFIQNCDITVCNDGDRAQFVEKLNAVWEERLKNGRHEREAVL